jgi:hypothetical protein
MGVGFWAVRDAWRKCAAEVSIRGVAAAHHGRLCDGVFNNVRIKNDWCRISTIYAQQQLRGSSNPCC